jgi:hypothetical protein
MKSCLIIAVNPDAKQGAREGRGFETSRHSYCCRELNMLLITDWWPRKRMKLVMTSTVVLEPIVLTLNRHFDVYFMYDKVNGKRNQLHCMSFRSYPKFSVDLGAVSSDASCFMM